MSRRIAVLAIAFAVLATGCSEDSHAPPAPKITMISDVGEYVREYTYPEDQITVVTYLYEGVLFEGDLPLADWQYFRDFLVDRAWEWEPFYKVRNNLAFPEIYQPRLVIVETCNDPTDWGCAGGHWWSFARTADGWGLVESGSWFVTP